MYRIDISYFDMASKRICGQLQKPHFTGEQLKNNNVTPKSLLYVGRVHEN